MPQKNETHKQPIAFTNVCRSLIENVKGEVDATVTYNLFSCRQGRGLQAFSTILMSIKFAEHVQHRGQLPEAIESHQVAGLTFLLTAAWHPIYVANAMRRQLHEQALLEPTLRLAKEAGMLHLYKGFVRSSLIPTAAILAMNDALSEPQPKIRP